MDGVERGISVALWLLDRERDDEESPRPAPGANPGDGARSDGGGMRAPSRETAVAATAPAALPPARTLPRRSGRHAPGRQAEAREKPPSHITQEPVLAAESADPRAVDGAGAQLHIREPWDGYADMTAPHIEARLRVASAEELAVAQLFEQTNRRRRSVLAAVERELSRGAGRPSSSQPCNRPRTP